MQVTLYSEENRQGLTKDWPFIPRTGDFVERDLPGGVNRQIVEEVILHVNPDGSFHSADVSLGYGNGQGTFSDAPPAR